MRGGGWGGGRGGRKVNSCQVLLDNLQASHHLAVSTLVEIQLSAMLRSFREISLFLQ